MELKERAILTYVATPGLQGFCLETKKLKEWHITITPLDGESAVSMVERLAVFLKERKASVVRHEVFGGFSHYDTVTTLLERRLGILDWPIIWTEDSPLQNNAINGMNIMAVEGAPVSIVRLDGKIVGRSYSDGWARNVLLSNICPKNIQAENTAQAEEVFELIEKALGSVFMNYSNVVRTWFFIKDILQWYTPFNKVRTEFYKKKRVFDGLVPASTGIGGRNLSESALVAGVWAVQPENDAFKVQEVLSPLQCPAPCYGSSFSRAVELSNPEFRRILISGTASIKQSGESAFYDDIHGQIDLTMRVVEAILESRNMDFSNITRSVSYFKKSEHIEELNRWLMEKEEAIFPTIRTLASVCRDELLFEIEAEAISTNPLI